MKHLLLAGLVFSGLMLLAGCGDNQDCCQPPSSDLTITFKALYDGQPLEKYKDYDYDTYRVQFSRFNTYMADITLLNNSGETRIADIAWVDFTPDLAPDNKAVEVPITFKNVPDGSYSGIRLGYGVPPDLNAKQPSDFPANHPLSRENEYWLGWKSYIFNKIEGQVDLNNNGIYDGGLVYHCGSDAVYRTYTFNQPIIAGPGANITVELDLKKLFLINGAWLDLNNAYNHITSNDVNDVVVATILMDNIGNATTVKP